MACRLALARDGGLPRARVKPCKFQTETLPTAALALACLAAGLALPSRMSCLGVGLRQAVSLLATSEPLRRIIGPHDRAQAPPPSSQGRQICRPVSPIGGFFIKARSLETSRLASPFI
jgi:hypothetical protein